MIRGLWGGPSTLRISSDTFPGKLVHERSLAPAKINDGVYDDTWDGRVVHPNEERPRRLSPEYGPCTLEIEHDQVYRDEAKFTIAEPDFKVEFADLHFATSRKIVLPLAEGPELEGGPARAAPLHVVAALLEFAADHPEREIVVYGHTDTAGDAGLNDALSVERARGLQLYLAGEREAWAAHCQEHYEIVDFKSVHRWAVDRFAWPTDPGPLDNEWHGTPRRARAEFRRRCDELLGTKLAQGVKQNINDWLAIFDLYDIAVAGYLECETAHIASLRDALAFAEPPDVGCGQHWPVVEQGRDGVTERLNRRAAVMFFQPGELPKQHGGDQPPGEELHASGRYQHIRLSPIGSDEALLRITLLDEYGDPMPEAEYSADTRAGPWTGVADGDGVATAPRALVDTTFELQWADATDTERRYWSRHVLATDDGQTEAGLRSRLANLGFGHPQSTTSPVVLFQLFLGLPPSGVLDHIAKFVNEWHVTGQKPTPDPSEFSEHERPHESEYDPDSDAYDGDGDDAGSTP